MSISILVHVLYYIFTYIYNLQDFFIIDTLIDSVTDHFLYELTLMKQSSSQQVSS